MVEYDVVIIGSGVAGALCADALAGCGRKILILEAARNGIGEFQREKYHRIWDPAPGKSWNTPYLEDFGLANFPSPTTPEVPPSATHYYEQTGTTTLKTFKAYYQRLTGGTTWAWRGNVPRMLPGDFKLKTLYFDSGNPDGSDVTDWPLDYDDLAPWCVKAEYELGVSGNEDEWDVIAPRYGEPFPMTGQPKSYSDQVLIGAIPEGHTVKIGGHDLPVDIITMAQARNTSPYDGRPACEGNHNCIPICPTAAKYDATVHLRRAVDKGVELRSGCVVSQLEVEGKSVSKVIYKQWDSDDPTTDRSVTAHIVVLAANAIESPKILLNSAAFKDHPVVGRYLMDHIQTEALGLADEPIFPYRGPQTICGIDSIRDGLYRKDFASFRMTLGNDGWGRAGNPTSVLEQLLNILKPADFSTGAQLRKAVAEKLVRLVRFGISSEQLPHKDNRVELSTTKFDALGIPQPKISYQVHPYTTKALDEGYKIARTLFATMNVVPQGDEERKEEDWNTAAHIMGTCRMGNNDTESVVNKFGRSHRARNLFIVGASVFPTASAANPTLPLAALALMTAAEISRTLELGGRVRGSLLELATAQDHKPFAGPGSE
jgi:glucose dehydrogenase